MALSLKYAFRAYRALCFCTCRHRQTCQAHWIKNEKMVSKLIIPSISQKSFLRFIFLNWWTHLNPSTARLKKKINTHTILRFKDDSDLVELRETRQLSNMLCSLFDTAHPKPNQVHMLYDWSKTLSYHHLFSKTIMIESRLYATKGSQDVINRILNPSEFWSRNGVF